MTLYIQTIFGFKAIPDKDICKIISTQELYMAILPFDLPKDISEDEFIAHVTKTNPFNFEGKALQEFIEGWKVLIRPQFDQFTTNETRKKVAELYIKFITRIYAERGIKYERNS